MEWEIGEIDEFQDGRRRVVTVDDVSVGVLRHQGRFYAFRNRCPHQGGPVCEGIVIGRVHEEVDELGRVGATTFGPQRHLVCPWHGMEFDLETGVAWSDPNRRLQRYEVFERDGKVRLVI